MKLAKAKVEKNVNLTLSDAVQEVFKEQPALYDQHRTETRVKA